MEVNDPVGHCPLCNAAILPSHRKVECPACGEKLPSEITVQLPFCGYREVSNKPGDPGFETLLYILAVLSFVGGGIAGIFQIFSSNYLDSSARLYGKEVSAVAFWSGVGLIANGIIYAAVLYAIGKILEHVTAIRAATNHVTDVEKSLDSH